MGQSYQELIAWQKAMAFRNGHLRQHENFFHVTKCTDWPPNYGVQP